MLGSVTKQMTGYLPWACAELQAPVPNPQLPNQPAQRFGQVGSVLAA